MNVFDKMMNDDRWFGFGYLGERAGTLDDSDPEAPARPALVAEVDRMILETTAHWTAEERFAWANSKDGRWFGDCAFDGNDFAKDWAMAKRYLRKQVAA
ncbi:MAG: hypothetical protein WCF04_00195 [Candidatus Nanopelagicales bacterium]